ncbi:MAG: tRNA pseudouridine(55) synthase TruB [Clostridia bacterium]|nr:tRNA pseudouridine(55) synthase TruB [Clostridia bacterium]
MRHDSDRVGNAKRNVCPDNFEGGVICINKPEGCTSHDVVGKIRRLFGTRQVGHTGTLDPMATGLLTVMVGRAVKASEYLTAENKSYVAGIRLGITTDTEDTTGEIITRFSGELPRLSQIREAAKQLTGDILQTPPMYSALKVDGKKLVDLARRGVEIEREARQVTVFSLEVSETDREDEFILTVDCSKGTYIRTLCADIGKMLGCGAAMSALMRTKNGVFTVKDAYTLEQLEEMPFGDRLGLLCPVDRLFIQYDAVNLGDFYARLAHCGCEIYQKKLRVSYPLGTRLRLCDKNGFFALGEVMSFDDGTAIKPIKQFKI